MSKKSDFIKKYPLSFERIGRIFLLEKCLEGFESFERYSSRVRQEMSSYLYATALLQHRTARDLMDECNISLRSAQRYLKEIPLPDTFLRYLYFLQFYE